jgi:hypothetical protein
MSEPPLNPYQISYVPVDSDHEDPHVRTYKLFSVGSMMLAAFLGSPAAGGVLLAINYLRLGRATAAVFWGLVLLLITCVIFWLAMELPDEVPGAMFLVPQLVIMYVIANSLQGKIITAHQRSGGRMISNWAAAGIGLFVCLVIAGGFIGFMFLEEETLGTRIGIGQHDEIYYSPGATERDARALGAILLDESYFGEPPGTTALITKTDGVYEISFILIDGAWNEAPTVEYYRELGEILADERFGGPLVINLSDENCEPQKVIRIE